MPLFPTTATGAAAATATAAPLFTLRRRSGATHPASLAFPRRGGRIACEVAAVSAEETTSAAKIGARVRVKGPLKVYHVPKVEEVELGGMEGVLKQHVVEWKGKKVSANLPFKVEFLLSGEGRQKPLKFFAHLKEEEFDYLD